jgi:hypothetical protein
VGLIHHYATNITYYNFFWKFLDFFFDENLKNTT